MSLYSVGEVCETRSWRETTWRECEVVSVPAGCFLEDGCQYCILVPGDPSPFEGGVWSVRAQYLRKKRPPQQDTEIADQDFIDDLNRTIFKVEEPA